jgi:hypothetical protein
MEHLKDELLEKPTPCPKCGKVATSVFKTGNKVFYNHGAPSAEYKNGELRVLWNSCAVDRPMPDAKT